MTMVLAAVEEELGDLPGAAVGVGPVVAAARAARVLAARTPARVVLIGTAGAYPGGPEVGEVVAASRIGLGFGLDALGLGYTPRPPPPLEADPALLAAAGLPAHPVLTVGAITTDPALAARLGAAWAVEHLETYAVAFACREARVPFLAVLGIANRVGPGAHEEWLAHRDRTQDAARAVARRLVG